MRISRHILSILFLLLLASCTLNQTIDQPVPIDTVLKSHVSVIRIENPRRDIKMGATRGGGVVVSTRSGKTYVLTAKHATEDEHNPVKTDKIFIRTHSGTKYPARLERIASHGLDAALISSREIKEVSAAPIRVSGIRTGEQFIVLGSTNPEPDRINVSTGSTKAICGNGFHCDWCPRRGSCVVLTAMIRPGFSGGGMYDRSGRLAGICVARLSWDNSPGEAICIINSWLREITNGITRPLR